MITTDQKEKLEKYAQVKEEIKTLETICEELNPEVLEIMRIQEVEEISIGDKGKLTLGERRTWTYSEDLQNAEKFLKEKRKTEERTGKADCTIKKYVIFKRIGE